MMPSSHVWMRHDRAGGGECVTSHGVAKAFQHYAEEARIESFHLHQLRHTIARIEADEAGSLGEVQEAIGHKNQNTTRVYVQQVGVR